MATTIDLRTVSPLSFWDRAITTNPELAPMINVVATGTVFFFAFNGKLFILSETWSAEFTVPPYIVGAGHFTGLPFDPMALSIASEDVKERVVITVKTEADVGSVRNLVLGFQSERYMNGIQWEGRGSMVGPQDGIYQGTWSKRGPKL